MHRIARGKGERDGQGAGGAGAGRAVRRPSSSSTATRTSCPAASASASRSPPAWCSTPSCSSPTSRCRCWTSRSGPGILSLLDGLRKDGMGILMITHDLSTAAHFADRIAVMYLGRIVEEGPAREVVRNPQHPYTRALITVVPKRDPREQTTPQILTGETPNPVHVPSGCRFHPRCPIAEPRCSEIDPSLQRPREESTPDHRAACIITAPGPSADEVGPGGHGAQRERRRPDRELPRPRPLTGRGRPRDARPDRGDSSRP